MESLMTKPAMNGFKNSLEYDFSNLFTICYFFLSVIFWSLIEDNIVKYRHHNNHRFSRLYNV
jgi:hypothetical protein